MLNDVKCLVNGWCNQGSALSAIMLKIRKCFLIVVQDYSISLTSIVVVLPIKIKGLQSLRIYFGRVSVG